MQPEAKSSTWGPLSVPRSEACPKGLAWFAQSTESKATISIQDGTAVCRGLLWGLVGRQVGTDGWLACLEELQESAMVEGLPCLLPLAGTNRATAVSRQSYYARTQLRELSTLLRPATHRITIAWSSLRVNSVHTSNGVRFPLKISDLFYISWRTTFFVCSIQRFGSSDDSHFRIDENNFKIS